MHAGVVGVDGLIDIPVDMRIDGAGEAVGDGGDEVAPGAAGPEGTPGVVADLPGRGVRAVDSCADAAHEDQLALQTALESGNVIFRQNPLPDLNADLGHVVHDGHQIRVGVVDGDAAPGADIAVEAAVGFLEKRPPHIRMHKQGILGAPVIVGEDDIRVQVIDEQLHIAQAIVGDVVNEPVHFIGMLIKGGEGVFKAHKEVALLKNTRAHEACQELFLSGGGAGGGAAVLPARSAAGRQVRGMDRLLPMRHIRADGEVVRVDRDGPGGVGGKADGGAPAVTADAAAAAVSSQVGVNRVIETHIQGLVLLQHPLRAAIGL